MIGSVVQFCISILPQCNPVLQPEMIGGIADNWQIVFLIGVTAVVLILCTVMSVAVIYASQRGRA